MPEDRGDATARPSRPNSDYFSSSRPRLTTIQSPPESPSSPRTPGRPFLFNRHSSSNFNSPGVTFRVDDEVLVFEFSSTLLQAGLGGEENPRSVQTFATAKQNRVGDYSTWLSASIPSKRRRIEHVEQWGQDRELWQMDLRQVDLGLVQDKIERAVRIAIRDYLLVQDETKRRSFTVAVPPLLPQPLLSTLLKALFNQCPYPTAITLLSNPTLCSISAGLRSALVVDIGWQETVVTAIYEYREVQHKRSTRALKYLSWETRNMLIAELSRILNNPGVSDSEIGFDDVEEVLTRLVWTRRQAEQRSTEAADAGDDRQNEIAIRLTSFNQGKPFSIPFMRFSDPIEASVLGSTGGHETYDDDDLPIPTLIYRSLLSLPVDVRAVCSQRILIVGRGASIPGLKARLLHDVSAIISSKGWDVVLSYGSGKPSRSKPVSLPQESGIDAALSAEEANKDMNPDSNVPAYLQPQLPDAIMSRIQERAQVGTPKPAVEGTAPEDTTTLRVRGLQSLGAWAGASMVAGLRVRGLVEIERERFLQHGLTGGDDKKRQSAPSNSNALTARPTVTTPGPGVGRAERSSWSLGVWA